MAIKPTIYKCRISLTDLERQYYDTLNLTIAQHPSETDERMMVRILAYCLNAEENLRFTKGLSTAEEPELWVKSMNDEITLWIEVGEPSVERIRKASHLAEQVKVYSFNSRSDVWWNQAISKLQRLHVTIFQFTWADIQKLATLVQRTMDLSITVTGESAFIAAKNGECEVTWHCLQDAD